MLNDSATYNSVSLECRKALLNTSTGERESRVKRLHGQVKLEVELRGLGAPVAKLVELLLVSVQPLLPLRSAVVFDRAGAAALPSKQVAFPKPTKSRTLAVLVFGQVAPPKGVVPAALPLRAVVLLTNAAFPPVTAKLVEPVASGVGRAEPIAPPEPNLTR